MLVPLLWFPCPSELQVGQVSGTALPLTHSVVRTQGHSVTTKLKLRGRGEKDVPVFAAGDPGTQVGACALAGAICHERAAGGLLATGQRHPEIMHKGGGASARPPGLNWLMGIGAVGGAALLGVSLSHPLLREPWKAGEELGGTP